LPRVLSLSCSSFWPSLVLPARRSPRGPPCARLMLTEFGWFFFAFLHRPLGRKTFWPFGGLFGCYFCFKFSFCFKTEFGLLGRLFPLCRGSVVAGRTRSWCFPACLFAFLPALLLSALGQWHLTLTGGGSRLRFRPTVSPLFGRPHFLKASGFSLEHGLLGFRVVFYALLRSLRISVLGLSRKNGPSLFTRVRK